MKVTKEQVRKEFIDLGIVRHGDFTLRGGDYASYYCDIKKVYGYPELLNHLSKVLSARIPEHTTCLAAAGYGGIPLATALSLETNLPLSLVRDKIKDHGTQLIVDGYSPTEADSVCIIDDVFTTGSSVREVIVN